MFKWPILFLTLPALCFAYSPTAKDQCQSLDLRNSTLGKVRDQGKIAWCYAFTASDMLGFAFDEASRISAADIALNYNTSFLGRVIDIFSGKGIPHETGFTKTALNRSMKEGFCPEEIFPSDNWVKVTADGEEVIPMPEAMKEIKLLHDRRQELTSSNLPYYFKFRNIGPAEFLSLLQTKNLRRFYTSLRGEVCRDNRVSFPVRWKVKMAFRNKKIFYRINEQLSLGRLVGLDYDARILDNKDHRGVKLSELHTSSIVGRRWDDENNSCEYLIRNSYGESCSRYDESYECQEGNLWLGESQVYGSMISVVYMLHTPKI